MGRYSVKRYKTKRRTRDLDLIHEDLSSPTKIQGLKHQPLDEDKAGLAQYYCIHCARYFQDNKALAHHYKSKVHKRRVKQLNVNPYSTLEAEAATGLNLERFIDRVNNYKTNEAARRLMESQLLKNQLKENDEKDKMMYAQLFPEKAEQERKEATDNKGLKST